MKKLARSLYVTTVVLFVATCILVMLAAEIFWVLPWGGAYFWRAAQHLWSTPIGALTFGDFGRVILGAVVELGSVGICFSTGADLILNVTERLSSWNATASSSAEAGR